MSRSYRKHPIEKWSDSEKGDKQNANRKFRRKNKQKDYEDENVHLHNRTREISDNWDWALDGFKRYSPDRPEAKENNKLKLTKMARSKAGGLVSRQKSALALLEARYEKFRAAKEDKKPWLTHGKTKEHPGRSYQDERTRMANEIKILKAKIAKKTVA